MTEDNCYIIYVRGNGFLTEAGKWSDDIVDAALFIESTAKCKRQQLIKASEEACNPVILKWL